jgi:hypothetical protein
MNDKDYIRRLAQIIECIVGKETADDLFEFAFDRKTLEKKITSQDIPISEHIIKIQLFNESTAYQTVYDIYKQFMKAKLADKNNYLNLKNMHKWLYQYISNEEDWKHISSHAEDFMNYQPKVKYESTYEEYKKIMDYIIDLVIMEESRSREDFYNEVKNVLNRERNK